MSNGFDLEFMSENDPLPPRSPTLLTCRSHETSRFLISAVEEATLSIDPRLRVAYRPTPNRNAVP